MIEFCTATGSAVINTADIAGFVTSEHHRELKFIFKNGVEVKLLFTTHDSLSFAYGRLLEILTVTRE